MATILPQPTMNTQRKFHSVKVDMTPMVDLGFLLITFFIFTTSLMEPTVTKLIMPQEANEPMPVPKNSLLTTLVDKDKVYVYEGAWEEAQNKIVQTNYHVQTGLGNFIRQKQQSLAILNKKDELMVAIKPLPSASYQDVMNALDEMLINDVKRYAVMDASKEEKAFVTMKNE